MFYRLIDKKLEFHPTLVVDYVYLENINNPSKFKAYLIDMAGKIIPFDTSQEGKANLSGLKTDVYQSVVHNENINIRQGLLKHKKITSQNSSTNAPLSATE